MNKTTDYSNIRKAFTLPDTTSKFIDNIAQDRIECAKDFSGIFSIPECAEAHDTVVNELIINMAHLVQYYENYKQGYYTEEKLMERLKGSIELCHIKYYKHMKADRF